MAHHLSRRRKKPFTLARTRDMALLLMLADQKGLFRDHGVTMRYIDVPYARKGMEMLIDGEVDAATMVETNFAYIGYIKPKTPLKAFVSIEKRTADNFVMRGADQTPQDLRGKIVGFMPRTTSHTFMVHFLNAHGLSERDVRLKPLSPQTLPNALMRGEIDAMSLWQPYVNNMLLAMDELGLPYTCFRNFGSYVSEVVIAASKSFLVKNTVTVEKFLLALKDAENLFHEDPERTYAILAETMKISGQWYKKALGEYRPELTPVLLSYLDNIEILSDWIRTNDTEFLGHAPPDYTDYIDNSIFLDIFTTKQ